MMYPFMTLNDDTGGFHNATCWLPEGKWEDIKGYSDSKMDYFKDFVSSVSHIIMELSCEGGFDALCEEVTPDPEELEAIRAYQNGDPMKKLDLDETIIKLKELRKIELDILELRKICVPENIRITMHAAKRLEQRGIFLKDIIACIKNGESIEQYPDDYPYPSCLILGMSIEDKYLHVVIGNHESDLFLITAYFPSFDKWESDFKTRKENA